MRTHTSRLTLLLLVLGLAALAPAAVAQNNGNDPGSIRFTQASYNFDEEDGIVEISVRRHQGEAGEVTVEYITSNTGIMGNEVAVAGGDCSGDVDYIQTSGSLTWGDGEDDEQTFEVTLCDDEEPEGLEALRLILQNATVPSALDRKPTEATLRIRPSDRADDDDDGDDDLEDDEFEDENDLWDVRFDQRNYQTVEDAGVAVITVERRGSAGPLTVFWEAVDGSATKPEDYGQDDMTTGQLDWADGEDGAQAFTVAIHDDEDPEPTEKFGLLLTSDGALLHSDHSTARVLIHDNDRKGGDDARNGVVGFTDDEFQAIEGDEQASATVARRGGLQSAVQVDYVVETIDEPPVLLHQGTLTWGRGEGGIQEIALSWIDDGVEEEAEIWQLRLENERGGVEIAEDRGEAMFSILDDDGETLTCVEGGDSFCLQDGRFQIEVTWRTRDGQTGKGRAETLSDASAVVWFFNPDNAEMLIKVLDACVEPFDAYWVFFAATTNVDYTLTVTDTASGVSKSYNNLLGRAALPVQDTFTFQTCQ